MFDGKNTSQKVSGEENISSLRDTIIDNSVTQNYYTVAEDVITNPTIVDEILDYVIKNVSLHAGNTKGLPEKLIKAGAKINKNFVKPKEKEEVKQHFIYAYVNIALIEEKYKLLDSNVQLDIHGHIYSVYKSLSETQTNIMVLRELFKFFLPPGKEKDPQYVNISKAFVLFFFDDCTIFEKTRQEKKQISLFTND